MYVALLLSGTFVYKFKTGFSRQNLVLIFVCLVFLNFHSSKKKLKSVGRKIFLKRTQYKNKKRLPLLDQLTHFRLMFHLCRNQVVGFYWQNVWKTHVEEWNFKGALSGLRKFLAIESPLKMMKNAFHFTLKSLFVLKIFKFLSWLLWTCIKTAWLEIYDVTTWLTNNCNAHITQYLKK